MYRVAVCFSGQPRLWEWSSKNIKSFFDPQGKTHHIKGEIKVDYFAHLWDTNTWRKPKQPRNFQPVDEIHNDYQRIVDCYQMKSAELEHYENTKFKLAWDPLFYSFEKSMFLKRQYELHNDFEYDLVIKARLDVVYDPSTKFPYHLYVGPRIAYTSNNIHHFPMEFNYWNFDDVIFYGHSGTMDIIGDVYRHHKILYTEKYRKLLEENFDIDPAANWYGPGCIIYDHCVSTGIRADYAEPSIIYKVSRFTMIEAGIDSIQDWPEVLRLGNEWYI